jgi:KDO2-lipid IV(A) lauroyltransferase
VVSVAVAPMKIRFWAEWGLLRVLVAILGRIGAKSRTGLAGWLGICAFSLLRIRRRTTLTNLNIAFGSEMTVSQQERLGRACYKHLALSAMEMVGLARSTKTQAADLCTMDGAAILDRSLSLGRGVILVTGHFGNWELLAASLAAKGFPISAVAARMKNPLVNAWLTGLRERFGIALIPTGRSSGRRVMKALKSGRIVLLLIDQDARDKGMFVRFFGRMASTPPGAATLAQRSGAPIVPCRISRDVRNGKKIVFSTAVYPPERSGGERAVRQTLQELTSILEGWIREEPACWFWPHRRFKTRGPQEQDIRSRYDA